MTLNLFIRGATFFPLKSAYCNMYARARNTDRQNILLNQKPNGNREQRCAVWVNIRTPLFGVTVEEMTERRKAGRASRTKPGLHLGSRCGSATELCWLQMVISGVALVNWRSEVVIFSFKL